ENTLDMAPNSLDDQYLGCRHMMEKELQELNRTEFETNSIYAEVWKEATAEWQRRGPQSSVLKPEQEIALMAYTLETPSLYKEFNAAVRAGRPSREEYMLKFQFKVLHFLLSSALRALRDAQPHKCYHVFRGVSNNLNAKPGDTVRFGQFASTSLNSVCAEQFGTGTIFSVQTCYGVPIKKFSFFPDEDEVLIPPFETFEVTSVTRKGNTVRIELRAQAVCNKYNCEFVKEKYCKNQPCDFSAADTDCPSLNSPGQRVSWDPLWGFLLAATALA
ncbi:NARE ribosyltransferase, partial [Zapornia atra]|nr:NARE ribosyltransferase [Zapornia atra]